MFSHDEKPSYHVHLAIELWFCTFRGRIQLALWARPVKVHGYDLGRGLWTRIPYRYSIPLALSRLSLSIQRHPCNSSSSSGSALAGCAIPEQVRTAPVGFMLNLAPIPVESYLKRRIADPHDTGLVRVEHRLVSSVLITAPRSTKTRGMEWHFDPNSVNFFAHTLRKQRGFSKN